MDGLITFFYQKRHIKASHDGDAKSWATLPICFKRYTSITSDPFEDHTNCSLIVTPY